MKYIGDTDRNLKKSLYERKRNIRWINSNNALFLHKNNDRIYNFFLKMEERRENEYERMVHVAKFKFNIWISRKCKYVKRKN